MVAQLEALRRWATAHGHELKDDHVYIDEGYSGARLDRPALDRLRDAARRSGMTTLADDGGRLIAAGVTTIDEVLSVTTAHEEPPAAAPKAATV